MKLNLKQFLVAGLAVLMLGGVVYAEPVGGEFAPGEEAAVKALMDADITNSEQQALLDRVNEMVAQYPDLANVVVDDDASLEEAFAVVENEYRVHEIDRMVSEDPSLKSRVDKYPELIDVITAAAADSDADVSDILDVVNLNYDELEARSELDEILEEHPEFVDQVDNTLSAQENRDKLKSVLNDIEGADRRDTVLPNTSRSIAECKSIINEIAMLSYADRAKLFSGGAEDRFVRASDSRGGMVGYSGTDVLACGIKTGRISLWMIPFYLKYILEFLIGLAGLISVGGFLFGGFLYLFSGFSDDKDKGKRALIYAAVGLIVTMLAWAAVQIVVAVVTA